MIRARTKRDRPRREVCGVRESTTPRRDPDWIFCRRFFPRLDDKNDRRGNFASAASGSRVEAVSIPADRGIDRADRRGSECVILRAMRSLSLLSPSPSSIARASLGSLSILDFITTRRRHLRLTHARSPSAVVPSRSRASLSLLTASNHFLDGGARAAAAAPPPRRRRAPPP